MENRILFCKEFNVPIVMFTLDFADKENKFSEPFYLWYQILSL